MTPRAALAIAALALGACDAGPSPIDRRLLRARDLERVEVPGDDVLRAELADALEKKRRDVADRELDAADPGELIEHSTLTQQTLDRVAPDAARLLLVGDELFAYGFRPENGLGNGLARHGGFAAGPRAAPNLRRVHAGELGGPDAQACADCHAVGGDDGAGASSEASYFRGDGDRVASADARNPPALLGLGPVQLLAEEMTAELDLQRTRAIASARSAGRPATSNLEAKGVAFGLIVAHADGSVDTSRVQGVSADLVVRPFGWKGHQATLRGMIQEAARQHLGMLSMAEQEATSSGRAVPNVLGDGPPADADADGVTIELEDGMVSTLVAYLAQLEVPGELPSPQATRGEVSFTRFGCASCHVPTLPLASTTLVTRAEQPEHAASAPVTIDVVRDGHAPKIRGGAVRLFSDLRRHDLGAALAAPRDQPAAGGAIAARAWLTRPLWGLADTAPYLHDGRAPTVADAVRAHGGEADAARLAFEQAPAAEQGDVLVFLLSLARTRRVVVP